MKWWAFAETVSIAIFLVAFAFVPFAFPADQIKLLVNGKGDSVRCSHTGC
jgi:hypothetical protein